jgi:hypothetical protein
MHITTAKKRMVSCLALAFGALAIMGAARFAGASHPRPAGATPLRVPLVPAYKQCTTPDRTHGAPLAAPSCRSPAQASSFLTLGTRDTNGAAARSFGFMLLKVVPHTCCPPPDVVISGDITDVRCKAGTAANVCTGANAADGPDYSGELQGDSTLRITDHNSGPNANEAATVVDIPFPVSMTCGSTSDTAIGGTCSVTSSAVAVVPELAEPARAVVEFTQIRIFDGGPDGQISTADNTLFEVQGVFVP